MVRLKVSGMTCDHCVSAMTRAVEGMPSVEDVTVNMERGEVVVQGHPDEQAVRDAIAEEGYEVQEAA